MTKDTQQFKVICPNCEEDISYYVNKGKKEALEDVLKIMDKCFNEANDKYKGERPFCHVGDFYLYFQKEIKKRLEELK